MGTESRLVYRLGEADVDAAQGCVRRRDQPDQYLRPKSLQVLLYLLAHRDRAVTKDELMAHVWEKVSVTDDVLVGCVSEVRRALGDESRGTRFIRTLPKIGYRFVAPVSEIWQDTLTTPGTPLVNGEATLAAPIPAPETHRARAVAIVALLALVPVVLAINSVWPRTEGARAARFHTQEVAWWKLDETGGSLVKDSSRNNLTGEIRGAIRSDTRAGRGFRFDGVSTYISGLGPGRGLPSGSSPRTLSAWIRTESTNGDTTTIFYYGRREYSAGVNYGLCMNRDGHAAFGPSYAPPVVSKTRVDDGKWHHLAASYEGSQTNVARAYVDGVEENAMQWLVAPETHVSQWMIGTPIIGGTPYRGVIDDVRVFDRALRASEIQALYRCSSGESHQILPVEGTHFYLPIFSLDTRLEGPAVDSGVTSKEIVNTGRDFAGVQFARSGTGCSIASIEGEDAGQDLKIRVELLVPADSANHVTDAGPYFRSRAAAPGDGIVGGTSAGYWVVLDSRGAVIVRRLNPRAVVAFTVPLRNFDPSRFHVLETTAIGPVLEVKLDDKVLTFDQQGIPVTSVSIPATWLGPPPTGTNAGAAGIAFGAENNRGAIGGQRARNVTVTRIEARR